jgi:hypothetical protein
MMKRCWILLLILAAQVAHSAEPYELTVEVTPKNGEITIGDEVKLLIKIDHDVAYKLLPPSDSLSVKPFEFKRAHLATPKKSGRRVTDSVTVVCTIFNIGNFVIPKIPLTLTDPDGVAVVAYTKVVPIQVKSILKDSERAEMRPIKGPVTVDLMAFYKTLLWPAVLVLMLTILYFWLRRIAKKSSRSVNVDEQFDATMEALAALRELRKRHQNIFETSGSKEKQKPAYHFEKPDMEASDEAMVALLDLQDQKLLAEGLVRQFHGELSHIFRHYVGRRYSFPTFEKTTSEINVLAVKHGVPEEAHKWLHAILEHCDFAKFSPVDPSIQDCEEVWKQCWEFVLKTRPPAKPGAEAPKARSATS